MTTVECLTALFSEIDEQMRAIPKHPEAHLWPSEVVTLGLLPARKGVGNRAFYRWLTRDYRPLFPRSDSPGFRGKIFTCCYYWRYFITPTGKPPPLAVRLEKALPFRRWVATRASCGSPASQATLQPQAQRGERRTGGTPYPENISEARSWCHLRFSAPRGMSPPPPPSGGILPQYPPLGGYPQTTRSAGGR